jgi:hypothetical protein
MRHLTPALLILSLSGALGAAEGDTAPFQVQARVEQPFMALKDQVGNRVGSGASMGYAFYQRASRGLFMEGGFRLDGDQFENRGRGTSAQGVGLGPQLTLFFNSKPQGPYLNVAYTYQHWALTTHGAEDPRTRLGAAFGMGYRFGNGMSLEMRWHGVQVDERSQVGVLALGLGFGF